MRSKTLTAAAAAILALSVSSTPQAVAAQQVAKDDRDYCGTGTMVKEKLRNGARWQMCWHIDDKTGLVLEKAAYQGPRDSKPVMVLDSVTIAQLNVPYDSGHNEWNDITSYGFGGEFLEPIDRDDCEGKRRSAWAGVDYTGARVLCVQKEASNLAYRLSGGAAPARPYSKNSEDLVLYTISKVGWYEYLSHYRFADDGQISVRLGATGDLAPRDYTTADTGWPIGPGASDYSVSHYHSAFWRVNFNIGESGGEKVEQYDTSPTGEQGRRAAIYKTAKTDVTTEANLNTQPRRWWRVLSPASRNADDHARSYELELGTSAPYEAHPETMPDVTFTQNKACEKFATFNLDPQCTKKSILEYADGEAMTDPIMWVRVGFHHVPRDEDQSPMPVHWQGFDLVPRDFSAQNPLIPDGRLHVNGDGVN